MAGGEWRAISGTVTGLDGTWLIALPTTRSGTYRARFAGDGTNAAATSPVRRVTIAPRIEARATRARVRRGGRVTLVGTTTPAKRPLEVLVWRRSRGANRFAGRFGVVERGRRFTARVRVHAAALYRFQIAFRGDAANAAASSNVVWSRPRGSRLRPGSAGERQHQGAVRTLPATIGEFGTPAYQTRQRIRTRFGLPWMPAPRTTDRSSRRRRARRLDDVAAGRLHLAVELELPVVAREREAGAVLPDVRLDPPPRAMRAISSG